MGYLAETLAKMPLFHEKTVFLLLFRVFPRKWSKMHFFRVFPRKWSKCLSFRETGHPDPYHGVPLHDGTTTTPGTTTPCTTLLGAYTASVQRVSLAGEGSPGFFRLQSLGQNAELSKTPLSQSGQKPTSQNCQNCQN